MKKYSFEDLCCYVGFSVILNAILLVVGWAMVRLACKAYKIKKDKDPIITPPADENDDPYKEVV